MGLRPHFVLLASLWKAAFSVSAKAFLYSLKCTIRPFLFELNLLRLQIPLF